MPNIVGVTFKDCGKVYDFECGDIELGTGSRVVIESEFGLSIGKVVGSPHFVEQSKRDLKKVIRVATPEDFSQKKENEAFEKEARAYCYERISARGLPMKLVCAESSLDRKRVVFYFTADGRIDFRELVKDLAAKFKTRIELRQIGVRDKAKLVGGIGLCGRELCCRRFLTSFEPISIKMAKKQDLTLNTGKLSGCCGRLMCCLGYEYSEHAKQKAAPEREPKTHTGAAAEKRREDRPATPDIAPHEPAPAPAETAEPQPAAAESAAAASVHEGQAPAQPQRRRRRRRRHKKRPPQDG